VDSLWSSLTDFVTHERLMSLTRAAVILVIGIMLAKAASLTIQRIFGRHMTAHHVMLMRRMAFYLLLLLFAVSAFHELGFDLSVILGAAGILSVAIGFASQTSASNLISGLFLIGERPFSVGDIIKVGETTGEVLSIDLLSVKLRTFDNLYVRIPNESLIKTEVTTLTKFPIRRLDLTIGVAYKEDINKVRKILNAVAENNPLCLEEPKPLFIFLGFGESSIDLQFSLWTKRENFLEFKTSVQIEIKEEFDRNGIEIPFPHRTLYSGSITDPFPVRIITPAKDDQP
jgi:small-conductance mechanosensitive channel